MSRPFFSVIVSNWNGEQWLRRCLSSLQLSARATGLPFEILVIDDASDDNSTALIESSFKDVRLIRNPTNLGFAETTMTGARAARGRVLVLCNNDLAATEQFLPNLIRWFRTKDLTTPTLKFRGRLFAVSARTIDWWTGRDNQVCMNAIWKGGRLSVGWRRSKNPEPCHFVQAGAAAYDRQLFLKLGGLDSLYSPGYWEDYDLSYRASKQGLTSVYDPQAIALHHGGGSMTKRFGEVRVAQVKARNHLLFEWRNMTDWRLLTEYCARLPLNVAKEWWRGERRELTRALLAASWHMGRIVRDRIHAAKSKTEDRELLRTALPSQSSY